jgi:hypothetical protein
VNTTLGSNIVTATSGRPFTPADVGGTLTAFTFPGPFPDNTPITGFISPTQVTIATNASGTFTGALVSILPACGILNPLNFANNNTRILNNHVTNNGFGGVEQFAGPVPPGTPPRISNQTATGISLQAFCGFGALNEQGALIQGNYATANAGNGIGVGACTPNGPNGTFVNGHFPGPTNNQILSNVSLNNAVKGGARFDLFDGDPTCDHNTWFANTYRTASPLCTTNGGHPLAGAAAGTAAQAGAATSNPAGPPYPLRRSHKR